LITSQASMSLHTEASDLAATELRTTLDALGIQQRHLAQLFAVNPRTVRHWRYGDRRLPHAVGIVCNLLAMEVVTVEQVEAAAPVPARTNDSVKSEPSAVPAPKQSASARTEMGAFTGLNPAAAAVVALSPKSCRFPLGDLQDRDFRFCGASVVAEPYCERHRAMAYLAPRTGGGHGVRMGFVVHGRHGRPPIPGAFSATGASRPPKILFDRAGGLPGSAPPPT